VNGSDFSALAANFGQGDSGADIAVSAADVAALDSFAGANNLPIPVGGAVPEPASIALLAITTTTFLMRRRRAAGAIAFALKIHADPHPNPLPEYQERG